MGGSRRAVEDADDQESAEEQDLFEDAVDSGSGKTEGWGGLWAATGVGGRGA